MAGPRVLKPQLHPIIPAGCFHAFYSLTCGPCSSGYFPHGHTLIGQHLSKEVRFSLLMCFFLIADTFLRIPPFKPLWFMLNQPLERRIRLCCLAETNQYGIPKSCVEEMNTQDRFLGWQTTVLMILWGSVFLLFQLRHNTSSLNMGWLGNLIQRVLLCLSGYWALHQMP